MTIEDLIHKKYMETDIPELLIRENGVIQSVAEEILNYPTVKEFLRKNFKEIETNFATLSAKL